MKFTSTKTRPIEPDMTPMIDVVFLLISFFSILVNFSQADQNQRINLPASEMAKPPDTPPNEQITLNIYPNGIIEFQNKQYNIENFKQPLEKYSYVLKHLDVKPDDVVVIIRADENSKSGHIQDVIEQCQNLKLKNFKLRVRSEEK
ncbi:MAG: biopolymer transporter ExbD [Planctomycetaceae bacterium]|jgi:biopolymer transport protein ExbD|nr:biopolymer transporter ExbD [Planctomycetaceae bacterium]